MDTDSTNRAIPSYTNPDARAMAIVGLSISVPGGVARGLDTNQFYDFLQDRQSGIITVPNNRWNAEAYYGTSPGKICTTKGGFIPEFSYGDLQEFSITPAEGAQVAISQVVLLHQAFNALQRSGVDYRGTKTGVYVGCAGGGAPFEMDITQAGAYYMTGTSLAITANRINYVFDLLGPSMPVDTACSATLTAMHIAVQAVRNGECEQAVVAGFNFIGGPLETSSFSQLGVLSPDGISKSFDDDANGYARGDVAGAVVIKRHDLAVRDFNRIQATLVGTALTSCGSIMGSLTTPSPEAQTEAIRLAYKDAGLHPYQADFVELHGTGTVVGDSLEANAAGALFGEGRDGREIVIGSVKSNIGHGEMGAYISSLVKVVMMLERKQILPNGYFKKPSAKIDFEKFNLRIPVAVEQFVPYSSKEGLIASISSFGFGGSCGHTVLREHEARPVLPDESVLREMPYLFAVGALSLKGCDTLIQRYKEQCAEVPSPALCEHLGTRARQMPWRAYAVACSLASTTFLDPVLVPKRPNPLVFCFSGQGPQHWQQGRELFAAYTVFRLSICRCNEVYLEYTGRSFLVETGLFIPDGSETSPLTNCLAWSPSITSVAIAFFQIALFDLLISLGLKPNAIVGHSAGETAVLYASGAMPRSMAVKIAVARGKALDMVDNIGGAMVAVSGCNADMIRHYVEIASTLVEVENRDLNELYMAAFNSPTDISVSGSEKLIDAFTSFIDRWVDGVVARKLRISTASHSPFVDLCEEQYRSDLVPIFAEFPGPHVPTTLTMSTVTSEFKSDAYTIDYLWKNIRQPVLFSTAIPKIVERFGEAATFMEISPHPVLSQYIKQMGGFESVACSKRAPSARHVKPDTKTPTEVHTLLEALGRMLMCGINSINFSVLTGCPEVSIEGPAYPFQWKFCPFAVKEPSYLRKLLPPTRPLNSKRLRISPDLPEPWISHHVIDGSNLIPAAAYIEMALEFPGVTQLWDCSFEAAYILDDSVPPGTLEVSKDGNSWWVKSSSALLSFQGDMEWTRSSPEFDTVHSCGKLGYGKPEIGPDPITCVDVDAVLSRCIRTYEREALYAELEGIAQFGPEFMRLNKVSVNESELIGWVRGHVGDLNRTDYVFHPAVMDAVFQSAIGWNLLHDKLNVGGKDRSFLLPHSLRRAFRNDGATSAIVTPEEFMIYAVLTGWSAHHWTIDLYVLGENRSVLFTFEGLYFMSVEQDNQWPTERYMMHWQPRELPASEPEGSIVLAGPALKSEHMEALRILDQLALAYTSQTLSKLPVNFEPDLPDRKRYVAWAKDRISKGVSSKPVIPASIQENYASLLEVTQRVGEAQKDIMVTSKAAVETLFCDNIMSKVYEQPPFAGSVFDETVSKFVRLVNDAHGGGRKRVVRVLEVGAGTGRFTALLGQALLDAHVDDSCYVEYVSTDVSISLAQEATAKSPWPSMTSVAFDLNVPLDQQNVDPLSFDIIVAFDVLHATVDVSVTLATLHELLLPGGHMVIIELDGSSFAVGAAGTIWMDFVFGSFQEWMGVLEHRARSTHCTLTADEWKSALEEADFSITQFLHSSSHAVAHLAFISQRAPTSRSYATILSSSIPRPIEDLETIIRYFPVEGQVELVHFMSCSLDAAKPYVVWLHTDSDANNANLVGLVRSIRHEFTLWKIYLVLFHPSWKSDQQEAYVRHRLTPLRWIDSEVTVDAKGMMLVPRIVKASPPPQTELRGSKPIGFNETQIWRTYPASLGPSDVEVSVIFINLSATSPSWTEFAGNVTAAGSNLIDQEIVGKRVFGVVPLAQGSVIVCHRSKVALIPESMDTALAAASVGQLAFVSSAVMDFMKTACPKTTKILLHAGRCSPAAIATYNFLKVNDFDTMITVSDQPLSRIVLGVSSRFLPFSSNKFLAWRSGARSWAPNGVNIVFNFDYDPNVAEESISLLSAKGQFIQVGGDLPHKLPRGYNFISIDYEDIVKENMISYAIDVVASTMSSCVAPPLEIYSISQLSSAYSRARSSFRADATVLLNLHDIDPQLPVLKGGIIRGTPVFDPRASYVVIGGIGGLGASISRCLVENGAKHIVLTSRSGEKAFANGKLIREKKIINYLRETPGVTIDLASVDCLDAAKTKELFVNLQHPVAGVFFVPVRLNDQLFTKLKTEEDWNTVYDIKIKGLEILLQAVDPKSLDFLVLTSSMATVSGSPGQANYAAAQTRMEAIGRSLPRTISIAVPPITDGGVFVRSMPPGSGRSAALDKYKSHGMSGIRVAEHCIDAIWNLDTEVRNSVYIPPSNWKKVIELGVPDYHLSCMRHLLTKEKVDSSSGLMEQSIRRECAAVLSLNADEVAENVPLSSYGLDSLTSVRLSGILKAKFNITVTQLQLLSNFMTVERLHVLQKEQKATAASEVKTLIATHENVEAVARPGVAHELDLSKTVVRLNGASGDQPLFILHGAGGGVLVMLKMAQKITLPVYGVQDTPEAPIHGTLEQLSRFYLGKIKDTQPEGPYRLGGFSFGSCLALNIAHILQRAGEIVDILIMLDGAPTLFRNYAKTKLGESNFRGEIMNVIDDMSTSGCLDDTEEVKMQFSDHFSPVQHGGSSPKWVARFCKAYVAHVLMGVRATIDSARREAAGELVNSVWPAKRTVLVRAENGVATQSYAEGVSRVFDLDGFVSNVELYELQGTHFGILNPDSGLSEILDTVVRS